MSDKVRKFIDGFSSRMAADIAAGFFLKLLEKKTSEDCYAAIRDDVNIYTSAPERTKDRGFFLARRFRPHLVRYLDMIDDESILNFLKQERSDLVSVIINFPEGKGRIWFKRQVKEVKTNIKNYLGIS